MVMEVPSNGVFDYDSGADSDVPGTQKPANPGLMRRNLHDNRSQTEPFNSQTSHEAVVKRESFAQSPHHENVTKRNSYGYHNAGYVSPNAKTMENASSHMIKATSSPEQRETLLYQTKTVTQVMTRADIGSSEMIRGAVAASSDMLMRSASISNHSPSPIVPRRGIRHQRSKSDCTPPLLHRQLALESFTPKAIEDGSQETEDCQVFCEPVSKKLICMLCGKVFKDPVITSCGHTFCKKCVSGTSNTCPSDGTKLTVVVANLAVSEQISELYIRCKYGCSPAASGIPGDYEVNTNGCPVTVKVGSRSEHERICQYAPTTCPNSSLCPSLIKMSLEEHLVHCQHARCPHAKFNCPFEGTVEELDAHLQTCRFEAMKDFLSHTEQQLNEMRQLVDRKDKEAEYMRGMFSKLTEKIERLEKAVEIRIDLLDQNLTKLSSDFIETRRCLGHIEKEITSMDGRVFNVGVLDVQAVLKCKGTFVGHTGPVWSLCMYSSFLFSGSSDNTIKIWDTRSNYKCVKTFAEHSGMILALCAYRGKLYSGSADCTINIYDIEMQKHLEVFQAHENPVCTLAVGNGMLFSGSLKSIRAWDLNSLKFVTELGGLNHWVRALVTTEKYLYCGSYQTIKIWDLQTMESIRVLQTSGGSVYSLAVSREYIICGTYENCIHLWDVVNYKVVGMLTGHVGIVYDLVLMTFVDSSRLISASYDRSLRVWSLDNLQCVQNMVRHQGSVTALAVSRGRLFSGSVDSTVKVWQ